MADWNTHLYCAYKVNEELKLDGMDLDLFLYGNLLPDVNLVLLAMLLALVACSTGQTQNNGSNNHDSTHQAPDLPDDIDMEPPSGPGIDLTNADVFETGYYCMQYDMYSLRDYI